MAGQTIPDSALEALNDNELEILRLLATGHTAKSIAASLGRSETAINERLREARRKTGAGSSPELPRLLAAQKFWDKNIALPRHGSSNENADQPPSRRATRTKGRTIMLVSIPIAALGLALATGTATHEADPAPAAQSPPASRSPLVGHWALDVARIPAGERPQRVTIAFAAAPDDRMMTSVEIVAPDGTVTRADSVAGLDGVPVPVTGTMAFIDAVSLRQPEPNTLVMTLGKNGSPISTRVYTVADDRQSMTETIIWPGADMPKLETTYFNRIG